MYVYSSRQQFVKEDEGDGDGSQPADEKEEGVEE